jgi:S1-C subfamily serine protease
MLAAVTTVDWIALAIVVVAAISGFRQGLVVSVLSLVGLVGGAYLGSRALPHLLSHGSRSQWMPLAALAGALLGAALFQALAGIIGSFVRGGLRLTPLRFLDSFGGLVVGAVAGLAIVWVLGATALLLPGQPGLRSAVQRSTVVRRLNETVPPRRLLNLLARIDPFPSIAGPPAPSAPPTAAIVRDPDVAAAERSVVKVVGSACGIGVEGSGWFARPDLVVTNAHVVAGETDTSVEIPVQPGLYRADVVAFDAHNDIAILRVRDAAPGHPLPIAEPREGTPVAILGYPENGPLTATPGRVGRTQFVLTEDAYGHGPVTRTITAVAGRVQHGNSGGPAVDGSGAVQATIFAARIGAPSGYGVPRSIVERALDSVAREPVSTGACAAG